MRKLLVLGAVCALFLSGCGSDEAKKIINSVIPEEVTAWANVNSTELGKASDTGNAVSSELSAVSNQIIEDLTAPSPGRALYATTVKTVSITADVTCPGATNPGTISGSFNLDFDAPTNTYSTSGSITFNDWKGVACQNAVQLDGTAGISLTANFNSNQRHVIYTFNSFEAWDGTTSIDLDGTVDVLGAVDGLYPAITGNLTSTTNLKISYPLNVSTTFENYVVSVDFLTDSIEGTMPSGKIIHSQYGSLNVTTDQAASIASGYSFPANSVGKFVYPNKRRPPSQGGIFMKSGNGIGAIMYVDPAETTKYKMIIDITGDKKFDASLGDIEKSYNIPK